MKKQKDMGRRDDLTTHENQIFSRAHYFRIQRYAKTGQQERMAVHTFPEAVKIAKEETAAGNRVLIYAVTAIGDFIVCVPKRWDDFLKLWETQHG